MEKKEEEGQKTLPTKVAAISQEEEEYSITAEHLSLSQQVACMEATRKSQQTPEHIKRVEIPLILYKINKLLEKERNDRNKE